MKRIRLNFPLFGYFPLSTTIILMLLVCGTVQGQISILLTADTEGHVESCQDCPDQEGLGGLARRATLVTRSRNENPSVLLVDAGNSLFGTKREGNIIVSAYNALGYEAVNLSYRDFRYGKSTTMALLKDVKFPVLSANLLEDESGELLAKPYVVKKVDGQRIAMIGVTQSPAGLDFLPHLKKQLNGILIQPPVDALGRWIPEAKAQSDRIVLIYYGSGSDLEPILNLYSTELAAILVGGSRPDYLPSNTTPAMVGTSTHGQHLAHIKLVEIDNKTRVEVTQLAVEPTIKPNEDMVKLVDSFKQSEASSVHTTQEEDKTKFPSVLVNREAENQAIRVGIDSYRLVKEYAGNPVPEDLQLLVIRGLLANKSRKAQTSIPDVQKAFFLRLAGNQTINLHPISEYTADPFWGPILLEPGEELPVEMVFAVPARPLEQATLRHISNMGPISVYVIGEQPTLTSTYLAGPASKGQAKIAIERINFESVVGSKTAPERWRYLKVTFWFTNLRPLQPLETDLAGLTVLVEDGYYVYAPVTKSRSPDLPQGETFYAQEPTPGEMVFLVPDKTGDLALVHFTKEGPLSLDLTPKVGALEPQQPVAGPVGERSISMSLFQPQHAVKLEPPKAGLRYVVLDVGLRLNVDDPLASFAFDATKTLELHDGRGQFYKPEKVGGLLRRPLGPSDLWREQLVRGEVAFLVPAEASSFTLVIPFKVGPTRLPVPKTLLSPPAMTIVSKRLPTSSPSPEGKASKPGPDSRPKDSVSELLQKADSLFERGQYTTPEDRNALALYRQVLELDPGNRRAREKLDAMAAVYRRWAERAFQNARYEQATEYYQTLRVIQPGDAEADRRLAEIERRQARRAAEELYRRVMRTVEETLESLKASRWKEAITRSTVTVDLADRLVEDHPDHPDTQVVFHLARSLYHMARAASFLSEGKRPEAKDEAERAIQSSRQAAATATRERLRQMAKDYLRRAEAIRKLAENE